MPELKPWRRRNTILLGVALLVALGVLYGALAQSGLLATITDKQALRQWVAGLAGWGPLAIVLLMTLAIVMSPIPSGPIAVVAGALYGPSLGTLYVVLGAETGAVVAFLIARTFGYDVLSGWARVGPLLRWLGKDRSQNWLTLIVFASRLVPFISFDAVSYAAGLTPLAFWRFALATLAGVIPIAYLLAAMGEGILAAEAGGTMLLLLIVSVLTLLPVVVKLIRDRRRTPR